MLTLNIVPIALSGDSVEIGLLPFEPGRVRVLREEYWRTHAFLFDHRIDKITNVDIAEGVEPLGNVERVAVEENLHLMGRAVQQSMVAWMGGQVRILRADKRYEFLGRGNSLLTQAIRAAGCEPLSGLEVQQKYKLDCRVFFAADGSPFLGLVIDIATYNQIDLTIEELATKGFVPSGLYVGTLREDTRGFVEPHFEVAGKVSRVHDGIVYLTDAVGQTTISADKIFLERRSENVEAVLRHFYGNKTDRIIQYLRNLRSEIVTAEDKLVKIQATLDGLRTRQFVIGGDIVIELGDLLTANDARFPTQISTTQPVFLFGPQGRRTNTNARTGINRDGPYLYTHHTRNSPSIAVVCEARHKGVVEQFLHLLRDGISPENWQSSNNNPYTQGLRGKYHLVGLTYHIETVPSASPEEYRAATKRLLERLPNPPDIGFIQTRQEDKMKYGDDDPYLVSKAAFMSVGVPTQAVQIEKIRRPESSSVAWLLDTISLAIYAKLDGVPFLMTTIGTTTHELVIGLGTTYVSEQRLGERTQFMGITSIFKGDGRYLIWDATREVTYENYPQALLETLHSAVEHVQQHDHWRAGDTVRLVFHVYKRLKDVEVTAIKALVEELLGTDYIVEFAFLDISWWHPYYLFEPSSRGMRRGGTVRGKGVPERGVCLQLSRNVGLLHLVGPNEMKTDFQGIPSPLLIELHPDSTFTDLSYLMRQIFNFSHLSWRTFLPGSEPVTITYSRLISRLLGKLSSVTNWNSDILQGSLKNRRWFL